MRKTKKTSPGGFPIWLLVALVTLAIFSPVVGYKFVTWDDNVNIYDNPKFNPVTFSNILDFWKKPFEHLYIPLTYTVWALQAFVAHIPGGKRAEAFNPHFFHAFNLLLHVLSVLVVFALLKILLMTAGSHKSSAPAVTKGAKLQKEKSQKNGAEVRLPNIEVAVAIGALFFALHPMQVESVAWVTGMKDVLCGLLSLVVVWQYLLYLEIAGDSAVKNKAFIHYGLAILFYILALLSKPSAVVTPLVILILAFWAIGRPLWQIVRGLLPFVVIAIPWTVMTSIIQGGEHTAYITPILKRPLVVADTLTF
ncbi:MAG: hypothetical protein QME62_04470, partial [Armatimonadota bacterium]|nr:hypothetical protein [Armatimonadota bacterium]